MSPNKTDKPDKASQATTDPTVGKGEEGMNAARRQAQNDALDTDVIGADDEHTELQRKRDERGSQIRGTGDQPPPVHGATRPVETSSSGVDQADAILDVEEYRKSRGAAIKVRAKRLGYYGDIRRRTGDVFTIYGEEELGTWMEPVDGRTPERITTGKEALRRQRDDILLERAGGVPARPTGASNPLGD